MNDYDEFYNSITGVTSNPASSPTTYMFARALNTGAVAALLGKLPLAQLTENASAVLAASLGGDAAAALKFKNLLPMLRDMDATHPEFKRVLFIAE